MRKDGCRSTRARVAVRRAEITMRGLAIAATARWSVAGETLESVARFQTRRSLEERGDGSVDHLGDFGDCGDSCCCCCDCEFCDCSDGGARPPKSLVVKEAPSGVPTGVARPES